MQKLINLFTRANGRILLCASWLWFTSLYTRSILILSSSHLH